MKQRQDSEKNVDQPTANWSNSDYDCENTADNSPLYWYYIDSYDRVYEFNILPYLITVLLYTTTFRYIIL